METNVVKVKLWGMNVGYLSWDKKAAAAVFEYEPSFLEEGLNIAPFTMSIDSPRSQKGIPWMGDKDKLYQGLPPMIADSLPDKWGNSLFKAWLRDNHISTRKANPVDHLSFIGSRAMGALEYEPAQELGDSLAFSVDVQRLYEFAKQVLNERETTILNQENSILWQDLVKISSSPGGKRPKAIVALNKDTGEVISGQGLIPDRFQHYIIKYDDNSVYPFAKLEYVYYQMALSAGIDMMPSELRTYNGVTHFLTQRFDRDGNEKIHIQTLAAMSPESDSYENIFAVIRWLNLPYEDSKQQYLRMVFNVIARNVDDHSKNFSFRMNRNGVWRLSPAYDLTYSVDLTAPVYSNRHSLTVNGKEEDINREDLERVGQNNDIQDYKTLIDTVAHAVADFENYAMELGVDENLARSIKADFVKV
ncbi:type II toxin-antitoxin system HipA family toxin [Bacteroides sp.]|uniref:type II toxin-antitoxin system HipA family toxin n=1 Tax=Bacteroides sp. TaxID=29523 RepID=UPI001B7225D7|nr:type II toxin-antitoxin system HipA family toxin [Bacteroides sp.]MBP6064706.1 type II toxin-antitoxin system HipA family toxin [Bacteroides sp.]MBP6067180.1 type II toxin-antitoxin system HipA family toxin [Bacteroides sp.]MBP6935931.1 type II toxin-antitoxin system HipA family toxin [Bacteroides sp.]MBP8621937.1 type II toxin-antitoxin system HipA family toxin [Bacteroides sp.]